MNSTLLLMLGMGGRIDRTMLLDIVQKQNERRKRIFSKAAEILFGLVMVLFGGLETKVNGKVVDPSNNNLTTDEKLNAIMAGLKTSQRGELFREFFRPLLIVAAEFLADAMAPDEFMLMLVSGGGTSGSPFNVPMLPPGPAAGGGAGALGNDATLQGSIEALNRMGVGHGQMFRFGNSTAGDMSIFIRDGAQARWISNDQYFNNKGGIGSVKLVNFTERHGMVIGPDVSSPTGGP